MTMTRLWNVVGAVGVVLILLLGYVLGVSPALTSASNANDEIVTVDAQNQVKTAELASLKALAENSDALFAELAEVQTAVPGSQLSSEYARQLNSLAVAADVEILEISYANVTEAIAPEASGVPAVDVETEASDDESTAETPAVDAVQSVQSISGLVSVAVSLNAVGSLANVTKFLNSVQLHDRSFSVTSTQIRVGSEAGEYELSLEGAVYVLNSDAVAVTGTSSSGDEAN